MKEFKDILKEKRVEANISQQKLADELNTSQCTVAKWETGENFPRYHTILDLATLFKCTTDELFGLEVKK